MMLHGRESLVGLVGKRKRNLSSHLAKILLAQDSSKSASEKGEVITGTSGNFSPSSLRASEKDKVIISQDDVGAELDEQVYESEWVSCPVCGRRISSTDCAINSHLDICLARGTKRKLTQTTLFQLSFQRGSSALLTDLNSLETKKGLETESSGDLSNSHCCSRDPNGCHSISSSSSFFDTKRSVGVPLENVTTEDLANCKAACLQQPTNIGKLDLQTTEGSESTFSLDSYIVGHKFYGDAELHEGSMLSFERDPYNARDVNAIKVICAESRQMLGYLPKELAKHLSTLIDAQAIQYRGFVTCVSEHPLVAIPIRIICEKNESYCGMGLNNVKILDYLEDHCKSAIENIKNLNPSVTKYQKNFCFMIQDVLNREAHLFANNEKVFLGPWFRMSAIFYPEISNTQSAMEELQSAGYISFFKSTWDFVGHDLKEILDVLTVIEMRGILKSELPKKGSGYRQREKTVNLLMSLFEEGSCPLLPEIILKQTGQCAKISSHAETLLWRIQDLASHLLVDLGVIKFPEYTCNILNPIFRGRDDLLAYEEAIEVAQIMDQYLEVEDMDRVVRCVDVAESGMLSYLGKEQQSSLSCALPSFFSCFSASWVYSKVLSVGVSIYERKRRYGDAIRLLKVLLSSFTSNSRRGHWMVRLSVDLEHMGHSNESLLVAEEGVRDGWVCAGSKMALQRRIVRLSKPPRRWKTPSFADTIKQNIKEVQILGRPLNSEAGAKSLFYGYDCELCGVEQLALQYYAREGGWQGVHSESGIWMTIFGLIMWDVLFTDVPDVFRSRFQTAPLDLATDNFYVARKALIESHLQQIYEGNGEQILITSWELHKGAACKGVNWDRHSLFDLRAAVSCIGAHCLASFCRHLALDYHNWSSGMPDLLLWRFHGDSYTGEAKLVEVKGPRDRLSEQQRAWMLILMDCGFNAEVCKVIPALGIKPK